MGWWGEANKVFGFNKDAYAGGVPLNFVIMVCTTAICLGLPILLGKVGIPILKKLLPSTLVAIVVMTAVCLFFDDIKRVDVGEPISSFSDVSNLFASNIPTRWSGSWIAKAIPFALNLTMLCYLDTLLTSLVMDQKVDEKYEEADRWAKTNQNKELFAQGIANAFVALFGGLPGAQATIRSVLILNEGAMTRVAGVSVGLLVIFEMFALQSLIGFIPQCVFSGILIKVGYDVFDWTPFFIYLQTQIARKEHPAVGDKTREDDPLVSHMNFFFIMGASIVTVVFGLNQSVGVFTVLYWLVHKLVMPVPDLVSYAEAQAETKHVNDA